MKSRTVCSWVTGSVLLLSVPCFSAPRAPGGGAEDAVFRYKDALGMNRDYAVTMETTDGGMTHAMRMAVLGNKARMEMEMPGGMGKTVILHLPDEAGDNGAKGVSYMIFPATKSYMRMPSSPQATAKAGEKPDVKVEELGKETVDNMNCDKRRVTVTDPDTKAPHAMLIWTADAVQKMPVRIETEENGQKVVMRFKDYDFSKPAAALFAVPKDYQQTDMMKAMMRGGAATMNPAAAAAMEEARRKALKAAQQRQGDATPDEGDKPAE